MVVDESEIDEIDSQWKAIPSVTWSKTSTTEDFLCEVNTYRDACGRNPSGALARFALAMLVMPCSNVEVKQSFTELNLVKMKLRNTMIPATANAILPVRAGLKRHEKTRFEYELPEEVVHLTGPADAYKAANEPSM